MKLISDYKDYYDSYAKNRAFSDQRYLWTRKEATVAVNFSVPQMPYDHLLSSPRSIWMEGGVLWFCGKAIPFVKWEVNSRHGIAYSMSEILKGILESGGHTEKSYKKHFAGIYGPDRGYISGTRYPTVDTVEMHRRLGTPVFMTVMDREFRQEKPSVVLNPCLKTLKFKMEAWDAFHRLEQFVSNELAPKDKIDVKIPDVLKVQSHGFDRFSFRKDKTEK